MPSLERLTLVGWAFVTGIMIGHLIYKRRPPKTETKAEPVNVKPFLWNGEKSA